jgi:hypothetical protein
MQCKGITRSLDIKLGKRLFCAHPVKVALNSTARCGNRGVAERRLRLCLAEDPSVKIAASIPNAAKIGALETVADFGLEPAACDLALPGRVSQCPVPPPAA